jgi:hypothetical protein
VLQTIQPLHVTPETPVFVNTCGTPIEPKVFSRHWHDCLRALGIRQRGMYCTKDTFVTTAFSVGVKIPWLEAQTGVAVRDPTAALRQVGSARFGERVATLRAVRSGAFSWRK